MDQDEMSTVYRGASIDASYQVSVHLAEGFQRRRLKCENLTDDRRRTPSDGKSSLCLWQGELKKVPTRILTFFSKKNVYFLFLDISMLNSDKDIQIFKEKKIPTTHGSGLGKLTSC
jgi:hypothetical protein